MKRNLSLRKIAASALIMSALAGSSVFADEAPGTLELRPATAVPLASVTLPSSVINPLQLAETYAPESVEDWKKTLEEYREALRTHFQIHSGNAAVELLPSLHVGQASENGQPPSIRISRIEGEQGAYAISQDDAALPLNIARFQLSPSDGDIAIRAIPAPSVEDAGELANTVWLGTVEGGIDAVPAELAQTTETVETTGTHAVTITVAAAEAGAPLIAVGWDELLQAVESQDSEAIRAALARQLELYKEKIAELTAGSAPEAEQPAAEDNEEE